VKASTNNPSKSRGSVSAVRATLRAGQHKSSANSRDATQKKFDEDPDFAASYMATMSRQAVGVDVWSRAAPTLDVEIPKVNNYIRGLSTLKYLWDNKYNEAKNALSMTLVANAKAFPPLYSLPEYPYGENILPPPSTAPDHFSWYKWSHIRQACGVDSISSDAWAAGIPGLSLHVYLQMCQAIAENDKAMLRKVTCHGQLDRVLKILKDRDPNWVYKWRLHRVNAPCRIVSFRAINAYGATADPAPGLNRLLINALVRFDTTQSLEVVGKRRSGDKYVVKPKTKRVLEYFIMEKKGWIHSPWSVRERVYDIAGVGEPIEHVEDEESIVKDERP
jgi:hypothetical protein